MSENSIIKYKHMIANKAEEFTVRQLQRFVKKCSPRLCGQSDRNGKPLRQISQTFHATTFANVIQSNWERQFYVVCLTLFLYLTSFASNG